MRIFFEILPVNAIAGAAWDEVWTLTRGFYETDRAFVEETLKVHQRLVLFRSASARALVGMAAVDVLPLEFRGQRLAAIYTSHVLLDERYRGQNLIQRIGFRTFLRTRLRFPLRPIFWFFDTFSYKSYLLMTRNFRDFWPRHECVTPDWERGLMDELAARFHGAAWRPERGVAVRSGRKRLRAGTAPVDSLLAGSRDAAFFARANPGHAEGDMLGCLCPLDATNWLTAGLRAPNRSHRARAGG
jgi:hypothetical protein